MDIAGLIIFGLPMGALLWGTLVYNRLVSLRNQVNNGWRQIGVQLKRRHDLIPNLVEVVKDYLTYEQETLQKVMAARSQAADAHGPRTAAAAEGELSSALNRLLAVVENYPELKANERVAQLMEELTSTENRIAFARQFYNDSTMILNNAVQSFPSSLVANLFDFRNAAYFYVPEQETRIPQADLR
jgi:LemA protein